METAGLWFLYNKLVVESGRFTAAMFTFQVSIITTVLSITQVPYTSAIMAHENMGVYDIGDEPEEMFESILNGKFK